MTTYNLHSLLLAGYTIIDTSLKCPTFAKMYREAFNHNVTMQSIEAFRTGVTEWTLFIIPNPVSPFISEPLLP